MIKFNPKDKKLHWQFIVGRKFSPFYDYMFCTSTGRGNFQAVFGYKHSYRRIGINGDLFYCVEDIAKEKKRQLKQIKNNIELTAQRAVQCQKEGKNLMNLAYNIKNKDLNQLTTQQIKNLFSRFVNAFYRLSPFLMMPITIESYLERELDKYLAKKYKNNKNKIQSAKAIILVPAKDNLQAKEQLSILKLAEDYKERKKITDNLKEKIDKHVDRFGTFGLRYGIGNTWKEKDIIERMKLLSKNNPKEEHDKLTRAKKENQRQLEKIIKELKPNKYIKTVIKVIREYIFLRTYRTNIFNNSINEIRPFLEKIAKRLGIHFDVLNYMILPEVFESLDLGIVPEKFLKEVKKRKKGFGSIFINGQYTIFTGREIEKVAKTFNLYPEVSKQDVIKGVIANSGKAKGIVKVLYSSQDNKKVTRGDILVTSMTTPDFISAMEKAVAFVTDEGGILCHAAIVSREMNKPCIIGTKIATKVLKDGDLVEVDADKGVVKIIKK